MPSGAPPDTQQDASLPASPGGTEKTLAAPVRGTEATLAEPAAEVAATVAVGDAASGPAGAAAADEASLVTREDPGRYVFEGGRVAAELGRGGIGRVLIARDVHLGREIAVKELLAGVAGASGRAPSDAASHPTAPAAIRFLREARVTGQLEHPNIVPVYELGQRIDGTLYYTMKLVRGRTLARAIQEAGDLAGRLKLLPHFVDLCQAVAYAHSRGVVHRDLKPENVMLGEFGETVLLDWGLAKVRGQRDLRDQELRREARELRGGDVGQTVDGAALGTPAYMSPEQADGRVSEVDELSDVWSLGAVLYELLAGRPPFQGATPFAIMRQVMEEPVRPLLTLDRSIPVELAAVAQKALCRDRAARYGSAKQMAAEVEAFLTGGRVSAYSYGSWELLRRFVARHRAVTALSATLLACLIGGAVVLWDAYQKAGFEWYRAAREAARAQRSEQDSELSLAMALQEKSDRLLEEHQVLSARIYAAAALVRHPCQRLERPSDAACDRRFPGGSDLRTRARSMVYQASLHVQARPDWVHRSRRSILGLTASADGSRLAIALADGQVELWDPATRRRLLTVSSQQERDSPCLALSPDGTLLAVCQAGNRIAVQDASGRVLRTLESPGGAVRTLGFVPASGLIGVGSSDGRIRFSDPRSGESRQVLDARRAFRTWAATQDGTLVLVQSAEGVELWEVQTGQRRWSREGIKGQAFAFSPAGRWVAVGTVLRTIEVLDSATGALERTLTGHREGVQGLAVSTDGAQLISGSEDQTIRLWDTRTWELQYALGEPGLSVTALRLLGLTGRLASTGDDGRLRLWRIEARPRLAALEGHRERIWDLAFTSDGRTLASAGGAGQVRLWNLETRRSLHVLGSGIAEYSSVALSPDGRSLVAGLVRGRTLEGTLTRWDLASGTAQHLSASELGLFSVRISPIGDTAVSVSHPGVTKLWDLVKGSERRVVETDGVGQSYPAFSPDGGRLVTGGADRTVRIWDVGSGARVRTLTGLRDRPYCFAISPDGKQLLSGGYEGSLVLWDLATGTKARVFGGHRRWVNSVAFIPRSQRIVSASDDGTVRLWSLETGENVLVLKLSVEGMNATPSPDGRTLAVADGVTIKLYPLDLSVLAADPRHLLRQAEREARIRLEGFRLVPLSEW